MKRILLFTISLFLLSSIEAQTFDWVQTIRPGGNEYCWDVANDPQGNVLSTGRVKGISTFGSGTFTQTPPVVSLSETDVFVAKYRPNGDLVWAKRDGGAQADWGRCIASDLQSNVFVTGDYCDTAYFGTHRIIPVGTATNRNVFIAKYDSAGTCLWAKTAGNAAGHSRGYGIATDAQGNCYVTGHISGITNFDSITVGATGSDIPFIVKIAPDGKCIWAQSINAQYGAGGDDIKIDKDGNILLVGEYRGAIRLGSTLYYGNSASASDVFVAKLDPNGNFLWSATAVGAFQDQANAIDIDSNGDVYVVGTFANDLTFGVAPATTTINSIGKGTTLATANALADIFLAKYSKNGKFLWVKTIGNAVTGQPEINDAWADDITVTKSNKIIIGGFLYGKVNMSGIPLTLDTVNHTTFVTAFDTDGKIAWYKLTKNVNCVVRGLSSDASSNCYVSGEFSGTVTCAFDSIKVDPYNGYDGLIAKIAPPLQPLVRSDKTTICPKNSVQFFVEQDGAPLTYNWNFPGGTPSASTLANPVVTYASGGKYDVVLYVSNKHEKDTVFFSNYIDVNPSSLPVSLGPDLILCQGQSAVLDPGAGYASYFWNDASVSQTLTVNATGTYAVEVTDTSGCMGHDTIGITVIVCTDIATHSKDIEVSIGPNPTDAYATLNVQGGDFRNPVIFELYNTIGQQKQFSQLIQNENTLLDLSTYISGIYFYRIVQNNVVIKSGKLMVISKQ